MRRARVTLDRIAALDTKPCGAYGISERDRHCRNLAAYEPTIRDYATWLRSEIEIRGAYPADQREHEQVAASIPALRVRLDATEQLLQAIADHTPP